MLNLKYGLHTIQKTHKRRLQYPGGGGRGGDCTWAFKGLERRKEQEELHLEKENKSELKPQNRALVYGV